MGHEKAPWLDRDSLGSGQGSNRDLLAGGEGSGWKKASAITI
jgi:hypothetical protein